MSVTCEESTVELTAGLAQPPCITVVSSIALHETLSISRSAEVVNNTSRDKVTSALVPNDFHALIDVHTSLVQRDRLEGLEHRLPEGHKEVNSQYGAARGPVRTTPVL